MERGRHRRAWRTAASTAGTAAPAAFAASLAVTGGGTTATADLASGDSGVGRVRRGSQHGPGCGFRGSGGREDCRFRFEGFDVGRHDGG